MARLISLVKPLTGHMILAVLTGALGNLCSIFIPILGCFAFCHILGLGGLLSIDAALTLAVLCGVLRGVFRYIEQTCNHFIAFKLLALIRSRVFAALRRLCPAKLEGRERGGLIALITADIELLEVFYAHTISPALIAALASGFMAFFIGTVHPLLGALAAAAYLTVGTLLPFIVSRRAAKTGADIREGAGRFAGFYLDSLRGLSELLQFSRAKERREEMAKRTKDAESSLYTLRRLEALAAALSGFLVTAFSVSALALGYALHRGGSLSGGGLMVAFVALLSSFGPVLALSNLSGGLSATLASGERVLSLLDETPETEEITDGKTPGFTGAESKNLTFSYDKEEILRGLSLSVVKGRITGISGKSGSGKSTFLKLLMRFWNAPKGSVLISGEDVGGIKTAHLRTLEGFVTQETDIFHDTIAANIGIGRSGAAREQIVAAAKKAALHGFIESLPDGYDTRAGELGSALSGGERQRIGLARAFLHDAPLLLLDEPTSNLDSLNEGIVLKSLRDEGAGRTVVLVSHRKSTAGVCDRSYSVENGRLS